MSTDYHVSLFQVLIFGAGTSTGTALLNSGGSMRRGRIRHHQPMKTDRKLRWAPAGYLSTRTADSARVSVGEGMMCIMSSWELARSHIRAEMQEQC
jgi:hypothetical protein